MGGEYRWPGDQRTGCLLLAQKQQAVGATWKHGKGTGKPRADYPPAVWCSRMFENGPQRMLWKAARLEPPFRYLIWCLSGTRESQQPVGWIPRGRNWGGNDWLTVQLSRSGICAAMRLSQGILENPDTSPSEEHACDICHTEKLVSTRQRRPWEQDLRNDKEEFVSLSYIPTLLSGRTLRQRGRHSSHTHSRSLGWIRDGQNTKFSFEWKKGPFDSFSDGRSLN